METRKNVLIIFDYTAISAWDKAYRYEKDSKISGLFIVQPQSDPIILKCVFANVCMHSMDNEPLKGRFMNHLFVHMHEPPPFHPSACRTFHHRSYFNQLLDKESANKRIMVEGIISTWNTAKGHSLLKCSIFHENLRLQFVAVCNRSITLKEAKKNSQKI